MKWTSVAMQHSSATNNHFELNSVHNTVCVRVVISEKVNNTFHVNNQNVEGEIIKMENMNPITVTNKTLKEVIPASLRGYCGCKTTNNMPMDWRKKHGTVETTQAINTCTYSECVTATVVNHQTVHHVA